MGFATGIPDARNCPIASKLGMSRSVLPMMASNVCKSFLLTQGFSAWPRGRCSKKWGLEMRCTFFDRCGEKNSVKPIKSTSQLNSGMTMSYQRDNVGSLSSYLPPGRRRNVRLYWLLSLAMMRRTSGFVLRIIPRTSLSLLISLYLRKM